MVAGFGHDRIAAITVREVAGWREHLATSSVRTLANGRDQTMTTANSHLAHALTELLLQGDPTEGVDLLRLPHRHRGRCRSRRPDGEETNVLDRLDRCHRLKGRHHQGGQTRPATHRHARLHGDRAIVHVLYDGLGLTQL